MSLVTHESKPVHATKLKNLQVSGFRSIKGLDLSIGDLTVLLGANGSGKSNLLAIFDMLRHIVSQRLQFYVSRNGGGSAILHYRPRHTPQLEWRDFDRNARTFMNG